MMQIPVVILCGGRGILLDEKTGRQSKALVEIKGDPMVLHVISHYAFHGFRKIILSAGFQRDRLQAVLDRRFGAGKDPVTGAYRAQLQGQACEIHLVDSAEDAKTGDRVLAARGLIGDAAEFCVTYSDTLSTVNLQSLVHEHRRSGLLATLLAARMPTRFRVLGLRFGENVVRGFAEKAVIQNDLINGGFYVFNQGVLGPRYLGRGSGLVLEYEVLEQLVADLQLHAYRLSGSWQHLDSDRDLVRLEQIVEQMRG